MSAVFADDIRVVEASHAKVEVRPGTSATEYRITGTLAQVFEAVEAVLASWSPIGYGTMVHTIQADYPSDVRYVARMSRSNSCE